MDSRGSYFLEQAARLYRRYGIKSVTMDDVARHLCVSKKTLYEHFDDKEALVREVVIREHAHWNDAIRTIETRGLNSIEELLEVYRMIQVMLREYNPSMEYDLRKYYPDIFSQIREVRRKAMLEATQQNLNRGKREGLYRKDLNTSVIARLHVLRIENLFETDLFSQEELTSFKLIHEIFVYHLHGILSRKGLDFFDRNFTRIRAGLG